MDPKVIVTKSTSSTTAMASPIVLRETTTTRLVFHPLLLADNQQDPEAYVKGSFVFQRKKPGFGWLDETEESLTSLKAGDLRRLHLHASEVHALFEGLSSLYGIAEQGLQTGKTRYTLAPTPPKLQGYFKPELFNKLTSREQAEVFGVFIQWLTEQTSKDFTKRVHAAAHLADFDAAIGAARLRIILRKIRDNRLNADEHFWQDLLKTEAWLLTQLFVQPLIIIKDQAYVGGKSVTNKGGSVVDFLLANQYTSNACLVEIKTPLTPLLVRYRNAYAPSSELAGAVAQVIHARSTLVEEYHLLARDSAMQLRAFHPFAVIIAGNLEHSKIKNSRLRDFELYRHSLRDLDVVTYDELEAKANDLLKLFSS